MADAALVRLPVAYDVEITLRGSFREFSATPVQLFASPMCFWA